MVGVIQVRIDARGALKSFTKLGHFVRIDMPRLTQTEAKKGAAYAASIAPFRSGALVQAIKAHQTEKSKGTIGWAVVSRTPRNKENNNPRGVPYHAYLEYGENVLIRGGRTQRYMQATYEKLRKDYPRIIDRELGRKIK